MIQSEAQLELSLVDRLEGLGWQPISLSDSNTLHNNLKLQLELHNGLQLSDHEFLRVVNHLSKGNVFEKANILRDRYALIRDDESIAYLQFFNSQEWCRNRYQVATQVSQAGHSRNRYDVTLLINGLPLVQIELKRRGMELKEAFNQVNRYQHQSYGANSALFNYVQIFVISNGVNTKYYANNRDQDYKQAYYWAHEDNRLITQLDEFADGFLEKCHVSKMIAKYIVLHQSDRVLMVLRPYQYFAVEAILERVKVGAKNGYIWHTTGSGKTLTSFKAAQLLLDIPKVYKVIFVVDRADLDYQTTKEFNYFSEGSVDGTDNTKALVEQLSGDNRMIVTTIQKLNNAITRDQYDELLKSSKSERIVFIFDECHRSQFGETHKNIVKYFPRSQMFGFTGTPIFADNAIGKRTTKDLFLECLHRYVITDAISDENVLRFSIEYWGKLKRKDGSLIDEEVSGINTKEFFDNPDRIESTVNWIIENHGRKTRDRQFGAIFCVSSVDAAILYYECFKAKAFEGEHNLKIATIFTSSANEEDASANGLLDEPSFEFATDSPDAQYSRVKLSEFVSDYNTMYCTNESITEGRGFYTYYKSLAKRMKARDKKGFITSDGLDILIVVNMFLTGFDSKMLNTLYVDKNLKNHGLIQAFSRTNRVVGQVKSQGNIVCFRNLKSKTDQAIELFSNKDAVETILLEPYEYYVSEFDLALKDLRSIAPTPDAVNDLKSEGEKFSFVQAFRKLIRIRNVMISFVDFEPNSISISAQEFEDYKSKYLDIHDQVKRPKDFDKVSIIEDVDFELELIQRDEINVAYILQLIARGLVGEASGDSVMLQSRKDQITHLLSAEAQLRSKKALIEAFIERHAGTLISDQDLSLSFQMFWEESKKDAIFKLCADENLDQGRLTAMMMRYQFTGKRPLSDEVISALTVKPSILHRKTIVERVSQQLVEIIERYEDNIGSLEVLED